jgi:hypothetical protein
MFDYTNEQNPDFTGSFKHGVFLFFYIGFHTARFEILIPVGFKSSGT